MKLVIVLLTQLVYVLAYDSPYTGTIPSTVFNVGGSGFTNAYVKGVAQKLANVANEIKTELAAIEPLVDNCEIEINATRDKCEVCVNANCQDADPPGFNPLSLQSWEAAAVSFGTSVGNIGGSALSFAEKYGSDAGSAIASGFGEAASFLGNAFTSAFNGIINFEGFAEFGDALNSIGSSLASFGASAIGGLSSAFSDLGSSLTGFFNSLGRRKRSTTANNYTQATRDCFSGACKTDCEVFLDTANVAANICGQTLIDRINSVTLLSNKLNAIFTELNNTDSSTILSNLWLNKVTEETEYYQALMEGTQVIQRTDNPPVFPGRFDPQSAYDAYYLALGTDYFNKYPQSS